MNPKFKVGQVVYEQTYGIGLFSSRPILEIDQSQASKRGEGISWVYRLPAKGHSGGFNWIPEENLFESLQALKDKWLKQIIDLVEVKP